MARIYDHDRERTGPRVVEGEGKRSSRRGAAWLQFPRRAVLLIAACAVAVFLLRLWPVPLEMPEGAPVPTPPLIRAEALERLPSSLLLLVGTFLLATALALPVAVVGAVVGSLQARSPRLGSVVAGLGRLALYPWMPLPPALSAFLILFLFFAGPFATGGISPLGDNVSGIFLAAAALALYPALLAAQDGARLAVAELPEAGGRRSLAALLQLGQALLLQTAGILSALTVVELIFARPGLGQLLATSAMQRDFGVMLDALILMALLVLLGRLLAELLGWLRRLVAADGVTAMPAAPDTQRRPLWTIFAALLLLVPLAFVLAGLLTGADAALQQDLQQRLAPPSLEHPLGTDALGRDVWARVRLGSLSSLARSALVAGAVTLPALVLGLLSGALYDRGSWARESLADLLLLPVDALLFLPLVPAGVAFVAFTGQLPETSGLVLALALLFLPRAARAARDTWRARWSGSNAARDALGVVGSIFLLVLFNSFVALLALEYVGFGPPPPAPSLGAILQEVQQHLRVAPGTAAALMVILAFLAFALYTAAAGISDFVNSRRPMVRLNE